MRNEDIARAQNVSVRWVQHLFSEYRRTGVAPSPRKAGRPRAPDITESEKAVVPSFYGAFRMCARYLEQALLARNIKINHKRIHYVLRELGLASYEPRKQRTRKWIRYEREHSNSLWHTDWHKIKDERWRGQWLIAYERLCENSLVDRKVGGFQPSAPVACTPVTEVFCAASFFPSKRARSFQSFDSLGRLLTSRRRSTSARPES